MSEMPVVECEDEFGYFLQLISLGLLHIHAQFCYFPKDTVNHIVFLINPFWLKQVTGNLFTFNWEP